MSKYLSLKQIMRAVKGEQAVRKSGEEQDEPVFEEKEGASSDLKVEKSMPGETLEHIKYGLYKVSTTEDGEEKEFLVYSKFDPVLATKFQKGFRNSKDKFVKLDGSYNKTKHRWAFSMENKKDLLELLEENAGVIGLEYKDIIKERKISPAISAQQRRELKQMEKMVKKEIKKSIKIERPVIEAIHNPLFGKTARRKLRKMKVFGRLKIAEEKKEVLEVKKDIENKELMIFKNPISSPEVFADQRLDDYEETIVKPTLKAYMAIIIDLLQLKEPGLTFMIGDISAYINHYYNVLRDVLKNSTGGKTTVGLFTQVFIMPLIFLDINNPIGARTNMFRKRFLLGYYSLQKVFTDFGPEEWFPELYTIYKISVNTEDLFEDEEFPLGVVLDYVAEYIKAEYLIIINRMYSMLYTSGKKYRELNVIRDYIPDELEVIPIETSKLYGGYQFCINDFSPATINKPEQIVDYWDIEENKTYCFDIKDVLKSGGINKYTGRKFTNEFYNSIRGTFELKEIETIENREIDEEKMKEYKDRIAQRIIHENEYKDDLHKSAFEKCKACEKALEKKKSGGEEEKEEVSMIKFPDIKMKNIKDKSQRKALEKQLKDIWKEEQKEHPAEKSKECKVCHKIFTEGYTTTEFQEVKDNTGAITLHGEFLDTCSKKCFDKNKLKKKPIKRVESKEEKQDECPELLKLAKKTLPEFLYRDLKNVKNKKKLCDLLDYLIAEFTTNTGTMPEIVNLINESKKEHIKLIYKILLDILYENKNQEFDNKERLADEILDRLKAADVEEMANEGVESSSNVSEDEEELDEYKETLYGSKYVGNKREIDRLKPSVDATYELKKNDELKEQLYDLYLRNGLRGTSDFELPHVSRKSRKHVRSDVKMGRRITNTSYSLTESKTPKKFKCELNGTKEELLEFAKKLKKLDKIPKEMYKRLKDLSKKEICKELSEIIKDDPMLIMEMSK